MLRNFCLTISKSKKESSVIANHWDSLEPSKNIKRKIENYLDEVIEK